VRSDTQVGDKTINELVYDVIVNHFPYDTFSARLNLNLSVEGGRSMSSRANIRIIRDNALQISVQPFLGIEMMRLYIDPQSVVIIDRMNRRFVHENISSLQEIFPIGFDFYTLQALFTNALFMSGRSHVVARDYRNFSLSLTDDEMHFLMSARDRRSGIDYFFTVNGDDRITQSKLHIAQRNTTLQWDYKQFAIIDSGIFPHRMNVELSTAERSVAAEINFSNIATNESFQLAPNIPNGFTQTSVSEIIRIVTTLL
jgi:hypothetical protein